MKIHFTLDDETTVTNTTVKVTAWITGVIQNETREQIESRARSAWRRLFPEGEQSFSNFTYQPDQLTFRVQVSTRIDATQNDQLDQKAEAASDGTVKIQITPGGIDPSIPVHDLRAAESKLRVRMIDLAKTEADKLGGKVVEVDFNEVPTSHSKGFGGMRAASATYESAGGGAPLGHSEKLSLSARVIVEIE